jgi:hypothetical protein
MTYQDKVFTALYQLNLSQLAIGAALESLTAEVVKIGHLEPAVASALTRHLSSIDRNCERTADAMFEIIQSRPGAKKANTATYVPQRQDKPHLKASKSKKRN